METNNPLVYEMNGILVEKPFYNKVGKATGVKELYFRASIQDYFIKICESNVSKEELMPFIDQPISVKALIADGEWDVCPDDSIDFQQSRIGKYLVIKELQ